jgi:predicted unusual protein kinase regulating ubiquinone biosynthesis (AarF/ABC1/UbiB family)
LGLRDPHPGNILALPGEVIAFMDFGIVGRLTPEMKNHVASFVIAMMNQSTDEVVRTITSMGLVPDSVNHEKLRADVDQLRESTKIPAIEIGFVIATTMFLWLLYSICKSGRF